MSDLILGLSCFRDDPTAALVRDGEILAVAEEERSLGIKHGVWSSPSYPLITGDQAEVRHGGHEVRFFPTTAIRSVLEIADVELEEVTVIASDFDYRLRVERVEDWIRNVRHVVGEAEPSTLLASWRSIQEALEDLSERAGAELVSVPHHLAHAASTVFGSNFETANYLIVDAMGEVESVTMGRFDGTDFRQLAQVELPDSLGLLYASITAHLGFRPFCDEQKTMGLAGYGTDRFASRLRSLMTVAGPTVKTPNDLIGGSALGFGQAGRGGETWANVFDAPQRPRGLLALEAPYPDVAYAVQDCTEQVMSEWVGWLQNTSGERHLCLAGGVCLNSTNNGLVALRPDVEGLYIHPQAGDNGTALGAALYAGYARSKQRPAPPRQTQWGRGISNEGVEAAAAAWKLAGKTIDDPAATAAELIAGGKLVGWVQGRAELGPRALGGRSMLALPSKAENSRILNTVKGREFWRPFAASVLASEVERFFVHPEQAGDVMLMTAKLTEVGKELLAAASHVDETTRPQVVEQSASPLYHDLLVNLQERTGVGAVLNTSYNKAGSPISDSEVDALQTFVCSGLDALVIGNYVFEKGSR